MPLTIVRGESGDGIDAKHSVLRSSRDSTMTGQPPYQGDQTTSGEEAEWHE